MSKKEKKILVAFKGYDKSPQFTSLYEQILTFKYDYEKSYMLVKELGRYKNPLASLLEAYLYMLSDNFAKAEIVLTEIMQHELLYHALRSDIKFLAIEQQMEMTIRVLSLMEKLSSRKKHFENLLFYFFSNTKSEFQAQLDKNFSIKRGDGYIRKKYNSVIYGRPYVHVWGPTVFENSSSVEYLNFIESSVIGKTKKQNTTDYILFFRGIDAINSKYKDYLLNQLEVVKKSKSAYLKEIYFRMLEDDQFYKFYSAHTKEKKGLIANLKRTFYRKSVRQQRNLNYSIQKLLSLGDLDDQLIFIAIAHESPRL